MTTFADSSAVVKRYVEESESDLVRSYATLVVSDLARVEVASAIWRRARETGAMTDGGVVVDVFVADWHEDDLFQSIGIGPGILSEAAHVAREHGLRTLDAIQLASAVAARRLIDDVLCFDARLREAFAAEGFAVTP